MMLDILLSWGVAGALLTIFLPVPKNKHMFILQTFVGGMFMWIASSILYALRRYSGMEYSFWKGE